jgi:hypothetical protein
VDGVSEIFQSVVGIESARLHHRQDVFDEAATALTVAAKTATTPQHRQTYQAFHEVVRRAGGMQRRQLA